MDNNKLTRRDFLQQFGAIMGTTALFASYPWLEGLSEENVRASKGERLRVAVIGPGSRGQYHIGLLNSNPKVEITYLCDDYEPNLKAASEMAPKAKLCSDYREVLDSPEVDAVVIATPLHLHKVMAIDAMNAGKHVFCEKSICMTCQDTLDVYNKYKESGLVFFTGQQRLYDPCYIKAIEMIRSGMFGDIQNIKTFWYRNGSWRRDVPSPELERKINWRLYRDYSLGLMTELACHQVQMGTWIWKDIPETVMGSGTISFWKDGREVEDNVGVIYTYKDGKRMSFDSVISNKFYGLEEQILGDKGTIEPEVGKYYFEQTPPMPGFLQMINNLEQDLFMSIPLAGPSWDPEIARKNSGEYILGHKRDYFDGTPFLMDAFVEASISGVQPAQIAEEGYYATILSLLGQQAIDEKRIITFPEEFKIDYNYA